MSLNLKRFQLYSSINHPIIFKNSRMFSHKNPNLEITLEIKFNTVHNGNIKMRSKHKKTYKKGGLWSENKTPWLNIKYKLVNGGDEIIKYNVYIHLTYTQPLNY